MGFGGSNQWVRVTGRRMRPGQELGGLRGHAQVREAGRIRSSEAGRRSRLHEDLGCPKVLPVNAFLSFGYAFLGGASAARSGPRPSGDPKCSKWMLF